MPTSALRAAQLGVQLHDILSSVVAHLPRQWVASIHRRTSNHRRAGYPAWQLHDTSILALRAVDGRHSGQDIPAISFTLGVRQVDPGLVVQLYIGVCVGKLIPSPSSRLLVGAIGRGGCSCHGAAIWWGFRCGAGVWGDAGWGKSEHRRLRLAGGQWKFRWGSGHTFLCSCCFLFGGHGIFDGGLGFLEMGDMSGVIIARTSEVIAVWKFWSAVVDANFFLWLAAWSHTHFLVPSRRDCRYREKSNR